MLFIAGVTDRIGKTADGNTVCDFDPEEIKRVCSISAAFAPFEWKGCKLNVIDVPGQLDYIGGMSEGYRAAECALIVVSGKSGISVGAEKAVKFANQSGMSKIFFVNKLDSESANFYKVLDGLKESFGTSVCPVVVPVMDGNKVKCYVNLISKKAYTFAGTKLTEIPMPEMSGQMEELYAAISEAIAETSDDYMEKFFSGEEFTEEEISTGLIAGVKSGAIAPVYCGVSADGAAVELLMSGLQKLVPSPAEVKPEIAIDKDGNEIEINVSESDPTAAFVFKTVADPFVGKLSFFKVVAGKIASDSQVVNERTGQPEKIGKTITVRGKKQEDTAYIGAGDIGAVTKLAGVLTGDSICSQKRVVKFKGVDFVAPSLSMAVLPKTKGEEDKIAQGLIRLTEEDPSFAFYTNHETHQMIISGQGDQHIDVIVSKLKTKFNVDVKLKIPKVPYRETIRQTVSVQGRHKKQSGGHGQFGDIWVRFEPSESEGLEFAEEVVGGSVPKNFFPAVEKGLRDSMVKGVLAGYPVVGVRAVLYDGSYHPVDSSEMAFKTAAYIAFKDGIPKAKPTLLEPIGILRAYVPNENTGDVMGEVTKRRGRVLGMNPAPDDLQELSANVPMAEMGDFATFMRQCAQGRGYFSLEFERYEDAPAMVAQKVIEEAKAESDAE
jgi:elongation factor G